MWTCVIRYCGGWLLGKRRDVMCARRGEERREEKRGEVYLPCLRSADVFAMVQWGFQEEVIVSFEVLATLLLLSFLFSEGMRRAPSNCWVKCAVMSVNKSRVNVCCKGCGSCSTFPPLGFDVAWGERKRTLELNVEILLNSNPGGRKEAPCSIASAASMLWIYDLQAKKHSVAASTSPADDNSNTKQVKWSLWGDVRHFLNWGNFVEMSFCILMTNSLKIGHDRRIPMK